MHRPLGIKVVAVAVAAVAAVAVATMAGKVAVEMWRRGRRRLAKAVGTWLRRRGRWW